MGAPLLSRAPHRNHLPRRQRKPHPPCAHRREQHERGHRQEDAYRQPPRSQPGAPGDGGRAGTQGAQQRKARAQHGLPATRGKQGRAQSESAHPAGDLPQPSRAKGRGGGRLLVGGGHQEQGGHREGPCQKRAGVPQHPRDDGSRDRGQLPPRAQARLDLLARRRARPPRIGRAPGRILRQGRAGETAPRSEGRAPAGRILAGAPAPRQEGSRTQGPRRAGFALKCVRGLQQMAHHVPRRCRQRDRGATRQAAKRSSRQPGNPHPKGD